MTRTDKAEALRTAQNSTQFKQMKQAEIVCRCLGVII